MSRIKVAVLRGGPSNEYEVSLKTGQAVLKSLPERFQAIDILIDREGNWHREGFVTEPQKILQSVDVVFNALHGEYGEDGRVQRLLDDCGVPYTGSGAWASALGMNKALAKEHFRQKGLKTPAYILVDKKKETVAEIEKKVFAKMSLPFIVKPADKGSSVGLFLVKDWRDLKKALESVFSFSEKALIEEFIKGKEATCAVVEGLRGQAHYSLLPIEIRKVGELFDYEAKYGGGTEEICPGCFSAEESRLIQETSVLAHQALGLGHYSRSDFILSPRRGLYILETNSLPGLTETSLLPKSLKAVGIEFPHFLEHLVDLALKRK